MLPFLFCAAWLLGQTIAPRDLVPGIQTNYIHGQMGSMAKSTGEIF